MEFDRDFKAAAEMAPGDAMLGAWTGTWQSNYNGHHGKLRAIITPSAGEAASYEARYHAVYGGFLTFEYTTTLRTT
ncbi:MAG: hypothetical protein ACYTGQ_15145, partial [Planctomycetota bacterium]